MTFQLLPVVHSPQLEEILEAQSRIETKIDFLIELGAQTVTDLSALNAQVDAAESRITELTSAEEASNALLDEIAQLLRDNATDPAAIQALAAYPKLRRSHGVPARRTCND